MAEHAHGLTVGKKLKYGVFLSGVIFVVEVVGGLLSHSLAQLSDAGHVLADIMALSLSWYGIRQAGRPSSSKMTFGYHRVGVIIAITNAIGIFVIAVIIFYEAYHRWQQPPEVDSPLMLVAAITGLSVNIFLAFWLRREQRANLNVRSAFRHVMGDALSSIGVIIGAVIIMFTGWFVVDPLISVLIGIVIIASAWGILKEGLKVLLEAAPAKIDIDGMVEALKRIPGVKGIHDVHVWSISPELHAMSCHVLIGDVPTSEASEIRKRVEDMLRDSFDIEHSTIQTECAECAPNDIFCTLHPSQCENDGKSKKGQ
jgi:cobalt-zinc-cadmium efflux system protein